MRLPCGTFNETYDKDMAIVRTRLQWVLLISGLLVSLVLPLFANDYMLSVVILIMIYVIASLGLNILTGYCGQISGAQAAFVATGAYASAILTTKAGLPFWLAVPSAGIITGLIGLVLGGPSLRIKGLYVIMATLAAQFIIMFVITRWKSFTGGTIGYAVPPPTLGGITFNTNRSYYYIVFVSVLVMTFIARNLVRTQVGRAFVAIRDNDLAAEVMGINVARYKLIAFFIGCAFAGVAGSLWAHWIKFIDPQQFTLAHSIRFLAYIIVGGLGTTVGPFFGVIFIELLMEGLGVGFSALGGAIHGITSYLFASKEFLFGLIVVLFLIFEPRGIAHRWALFKAAYRLHPFTR
jgi:branched-chain amino acid transport system permease protein